MSYPASNKGNRKISVTGIEIMGTVALPEEYEIVHMLFTDRAGVAARNRNINLG